MEELDDENIRNPVHRTLRLAVSRALDEDDIKVKVMTVMSYFHHKDVTFDMLMEVADEITKGEVNTFTCIL